MARYAVIGGSKGIGRQLVHQLAGQGHQVLVYSRTQPTDIDALNISWHEWDVRNEDWGACPLPESLDGLAYCPGTINLKPFHRTSIHEFKDEFELNFFGAVKAIHHLLPLLKQSERASVVLFSTVAVSQGMPFHSGIASAKGAVEGLARSLAAEYAPRIRFNVVAPSLTNTGLAERLLSTEEKKQASAERHPLKRVGTPEELAASATWLLTGESTWMTAQVVHVDGGMSSIRTI
jgi:3-oxoacyl-[acyl-carrier protein] reductase